MFVKTSKCVVNNISKVANFEIFLYRRVELTQWIKNANMLVFVHKHCNYTVVWYTDQEGRWTFEHVWCIAQSI